MENKFEEVKKKLKETFFGIDEQIDQVVKSFETWESVKDYQVRPMTVCLWGLTGTGKTALINKTIELLELNKKKFYIKFGSKTSGLDDDFEQNTCDDTIFILDEFQYFKSKKEDGSEIERDEDNSTNIIWELLDGGIVNLYGQLLNHSYEKYQLISAIYTLKYLDDIGAKLANGIISHKDLRVHLAKLSITPDTESEIKNFIKSFIEIPSLENLLKYDSRDPCDKPINGNNGIVEEEKEDEEVISRTEVLLRTVLSMNYNNFHNYVRSRDIEYSFNSWKELFDFLISFKSIPDLLKFMQTVKNSKPKLETRNYAKSLIFVIGNLDECFTMSKDLNSDLDADYFYKKTKSITTIDIRKSLLNRFRSEQIARLGSTHIIYPSLNKKAFQEIINKELNEFKGIVLQKFPDNVSDVTFSNKIKDLIYKEGVFPVIGARSIFSIVNEIVSEKFTYIIKLMISLGDKSNLKLAFDYKNNKSVIELLTYDENGIIDKMEFKYNKKVDQLRSEKNKGKQTHRAVHEAGHAVCSIILEHSFPEVVYSVVLDAKNSGFNLLKSEDFYYYRKNTYIDNIATSLAGYVAEAMIFGDENVSNGCSSDISSATKLLSVLYKDCGFIDNKIGSYVSNNFTSTMFENANYSIVDNDSIIQDAINHNMKIGFELASKTLEKQMPLFLKISEYLSIHPKATNKKLKQLTKSYVVGTKMNELIEDKEKFYTDMFKQKLVKVQSVK